MIMTMSFMFVFPFDMRFRLFLQLHKLKHVNIGYNIKTFF
jgi:hypothetical protein